MIEYGDPQLIIAGTTAKMMQEISLKIDQHIIDTLIRPAFEAGFALGEDQAYQDCLGAWPYTPSAPDFEEWLAGFIATLGGREADE